MKWTKTSPKVAGHYWFKDGLTDNNGVILKVRKEDGRNDFSALGEDICFSFKGGTKYNDIDWSDQPIPEPSCRTFLTY